MVFFVVVFLWFVVIAEKKKRRLEGVQLSCVQLTRRTRSQMPAEPVSSFSTRRTRSVDSASCEARDRALISGEEAGCRCLSFGCPYVERVGSKRGRSSL